MNSVIYLIPKIEAKNNSHHSRVGTLPLNSTSWAVPYAATTGLLRRKTFNDEKNQWNLLGVDFRRSRIKA
jgi:hypothetical protein